MMTRMRIPREWLTIRRQMAIVAILALYFAWIAWMIAPLGDEMPPLKLSPVPRLEVDNPVVELGRMPQMAKGQQAWVIKNTGKDSLEIWMLDIGDCGCIVSAIDKVRIHGQPGSHPLSRGTSKVSIPAGGKATIVMRWETRRCVGRSGTYVALGTNDPKQPEFRLRIVAELAPPGP
jgi:hypothetical protein